MQEHGQSGEVCVPRLKSSQCRDHMATLPWFWPDAQRLGDCGHRLLCRHFTMADTACLDLPSVQTPGRQRLRANMTYVPTPPVNDFCLTLWEFLFHSLFCFMWEVSLTLLILFYVGSFSYTARAVLCGEFLLHSQCCFLWEFVLHAPCYFGHVGNFS